MKTILVPTDFSAAASRASDYALRLAHHLKSDIELCHVTMTEDQSQCPNLQISKKLEHQAQQMRLQMLPSTAGTFVPLVRVACRAGSVVPTISKLATDDKIPLIIMGRTGKFNQHPIGAVNAPLLLLPPGAKQDLPQQVIFATDMHLSDINAILSVATFARDLRAKLTIVMINLNRANETGAQKVAEKFKALVQAQVNYADIIYRETSGLYLRKTWLQLLQNNLAVLLAVGHLIHHKTGRELIKHSTVPLLCCPSMRTTKPIIY